MSSGSATRTWADSPFRAPDVTDTIDGTGARLYLSAGSPMVQSSTAPDGITVVELVARGRSRTSGCCANGHAPTKTLSPKHSRPPSPRTCRPAWSTNPRPYLDIARQIEVLNLLHELHQQARTVVAVLHDLNRPVSSPTALSVVTDPAPDSNSTSPSAPSRPSVSAWPTPTLTSKPCA